MLRDKPIDTLVDKKQNYPFFRMGLMVESFDTDSPTNQLRFDNSTQSL